ncbi:MAG: OmpH family outer membrane protein [Gammaproteobacteria bacterium]|nr:OmpH family outer membrane protein [Gammaproteobacteria bacterium]
MACGSKTRKNGSSSRSARRSEPIAYSEVGLTMRMFPKVMILAMAAIAVLAGAPAMAEIKVGVLDFGRLMDESPQGKALIESLRSEVAAKQRELQTQSTSIQGKRDKLVKDRATMTSDQVSRAEKELRDGERDLARRQQEVNDDFNARRNEEMSKLQRTLIEEVRTYSKAQNFDLVVTDGVIYAIQTLDITPGVLSALQQRVSAAAPAKPATR